jgi:uncharacterized protein (DUF305 family)
VVTAPAEASEDVEYIDGLSYPRVVVLVLAFCFLAGVIGWRVGDRGDATTGPVDTGFLTDMRTHHEQALEMALVELARGENPVVVGFAREILIFQSRQLGWLDANLGERDLAPSRRPETAMDWMGHALPWREMPGLATDDQLQELRAASGNDADTMFLELMAEHHRGGIDMSLYASEHAESADIAAMAATMAAFQRTEIAEYIDVARREGLPAQIEPYTEGAAHGG